MFPSPRSPPHSYNLTIKRGVVSRLISPFSVYLLDNQLIIFIVRIFTILEL